MRAHYFIFRKNSHFITPEDEYWRKDDLKAIEERYLYIKKER